jgi:hypothetical protein
LPWEAEKFFRKRLRSKPPHMQAAILRCITRLEENPRHPGLNVHEVEGTDDVWEAYVDDKNRITFHMEGPVIVLRNNCNHDIVRQRP